MELSLFILLLFNYINIIYKNLNYLICLILCVIYTKHQEWH